MIRRWSHINLFNKTSLITRKSFFIKFFSNFKKSIRFKKYRVKLTKFTRKGWFKLKRNGNWYIYFQIFKYWLQEYKYCKMYFKFQFNHQISNYNFLSYNTTYFKVKKFAEVLPNYNNFFLLQFLTKKSLNYFIPFYKLKTYVGFYFFTNILNNDRLKLLFESNYMTHSIGIADSTNTITTMTKVANYFDINHYELISIQLFCLTLKNVNVLYHLLIIIWVNLLFKR